MKKAYLSFATLAVIAICVFAACQNTDDKVIETVQTEETSVETETISAEYVEDIPYSDVEEEKEGTYQYYIDELDIVLEIPKQINVYRTEAIYLDWNGKAFRFPACQWIIFTEKEYEDTYWNTVDFAEIPEEAKSIVYILGITPRELSPITRYFDAVFFGANEFVTADYYCEKVYPDGVRLEDGLYYGTKTGVESDKKYTDWIKEWEKVIADATLGTQYISQEADYLLRAMQMDDNSRWGFVDERWQKSYQEAIEELTNHPDKYVYDEIETAEKIEDVKQDYSRIYEGDYDYILKDKGEYLTNVYVDESSDIYLRAYFYAQTIDQDQEPWCDLSDIMIIFQEWNKSQRSYVAYAAGQWLAAGSDYMVDLDEAYEYLDNIFLEE